MRGSSLPPRAGVSADLIETMYVGVVVQHERVHHFDVPARACAVQRRVSVAVGVVDVELTGGQQRLDTRHVALASRLEKVIICVIKCRRCSQWRCMRECMSCTLRLLMVVLRLVGGGVADGESIKVALAAAEQVGEHIVCVIAPLSCSECCLCGCRV